MTDTPETAPVEVTQADRDAAAKWLRSVHSVYLAQWIEGTGEAPEWAESSNPDEYSLVQAFARHRTTPEAARQDVREASKRLIEACMRAGYSVGDDAHRKALSDAVINASVAISKEDRVR